MAFVGGQRVLFPPGYMLEDSHGIPTEYEFPPRPWTPGEGLVRSANLALRRTFGNLGDVYNSIRRREIMDAHDLSTYGMPSYDYHDVVRLIYGDGGIMALQRQIIAMGGQPMPVPDPIAKALHKHLMNHSAYNDIWNKPIGSLKAVQFLVKCQEFADFRLINEQINMAPYGAPSPSYLQAAN